MEIFRKIGAKRQRRWPQKQAEQQKQKQQQKPQKPQKPQQEPQPQSLKLGPGH